MGLTGTNSSDCLSPGDRFLRMRSWTFGAGAARYTTTIAGVPGFVRVWINPRPRRGIMDALRLKFNPMDSSRIGYAIFGFDDERVELSDIKIYLHFQQKGIGTAFWTSARAALRSAGVKHIHGTMQGDTPKLARWYHRLGFVIDGEAIKIDL